MGVFGVCFPIDGNAAAPNCPTAFLCHHHLSCPLGLKRLTIGWTAIHLGKASGLEKNKDGWELLF